MKRILTTFKEKWPEYFLEALVIVASILGAYALDSWNEGRKENKLEANYYCRLLEDINEDKQRLTEQINETKDRLTSANRMLGLLQQKEPDPSQVIIELVNSIKGSNFSYKAATSAFEDIKSGGNLNLISDIDLKNNLIIYYNDSKQILENVSANGIAMDDKFFQNGKYKEIGFHYFIQEVYKYDSTFVDVPLLLSNYNMSENTIDDLTDHALFFIAVNNRNLEHFDSFKEKIKVMEVILAKKCQS